MEAEPSRPRFCSRNDIIANLSVIAAGATVWRWQSSWPDLVVGVGIALLFLVSAVGVLRDAQRLDAGHVA